MVKFLEPKYLKLLVIASILAIIALQASGNVPPLQTSPPPESRLTKIGRRIHQRFVAPVAGRVGRWNDQSRWR
jgi:hypothetical protein